MRHPIDVHVGARLKLLRHQRGWSQTGLAERAGMTYQQLQKYENGSNRVSVSRLVELAQALDAPLRAFFDGIVEESSPGPVPSYREPSTVDYDIARLLEQVDDMRVRGHLSALIRALARMT